MICFLTSFPVLYPQNTHARLQFNDSGNSSIPPTHPASLPGPWSRLTCHGFFRTSSKFHLSSCTSAMACITVSLMWCQTYMCSPDGDFLEDVGKIHLSIPQSNLHSTFRIVNKCLLKCWVVKLPSLRLNGRSWDWHKVQYFQHVISVGPYRWPNSDKLLDRKGDLNYISKGRCNLAHMVG